MNRAFADNTNQTRSEPSCVVLLASVAPGLFGSAGDLSER